MTSIVLFLGFVVFYFMLFEKMKMKTKINFIVSLFLALPALKVDSIAFILNLHILILLVLWIIIMKLFHQKEWMLEKALFVIVMISLGMCCYGNYNMKQIHITHYEVESVQLSKDYKIVMLSDLHGRNSVDENQLQNIVNEIQQMKPDYVFLNGDIVDEFTSKEEMEEIFNELGSLTQTSAVYYVYGNHDDNKYSLFKKYRREEMEAVMKDAKIRILEDEQIQLTEDVSLIGRSDVKDRKSPREYSDDGFTIVLEHRPKELEEWSKKGAELVLSGHTHAGQIFPLYFIYELFGINEMNYGNEKIGNMNAITTSGISGWGFPVRTQGVSEIVEIDLISVEK